MAAAAPPRGRPRGTCTPVTRRPEPPSPAHTSPYAGASPTTMASPSALGSTTPALRNMRERLLSVRAQAYNAAWDAVFSDGGHDLQRVRDDYFGTDDRALQAYMAAVLSAISTVGPQQRAYGNEFMEFVGTSSERCLAPMPAWVGRQQQHHHRSISALLTEGERQQQQQADDHSGSPEAAATQTGKPAERQQQPTGGDDDATYQYITLLMHDPGHAAGYYRVQLSVALAWFVRLLGAERTEAQRYDCIGQLPRAVLRPLSDATLQAPMKANFVRALCARLLKSTSVDGNAWWFDGTTVHALDTYLYPVHQFAVYYEDCVAMARSAAVTFLDEDPCSAERPTSRMRTDAPDAVDVDAPAHQPGARTDAPSAEALDEAQWASALGLDRGALPGGRLVAPERARLSPEQIAIACHLYLAYAFHNPCIAAPWRASARLLDPNAPGAATLAEHGAPWIGADSPQTLYPLFAAMVAGVDVDAATNDTLVQLYMRDSGATYRRLSELAEEVRALLLSDVELVDGDDGPDDALSSRKRALLRHLAIEADVLARHACLPRVAHFERERRHVAVPLARWPFGEFIYAFDQQAAPSEQRRLYTWLEQHLARVVPVNVQELLSAQRLRDFDADERTASQALHDEARALFGRMRRYDTDIVVMRFPSSGCGSSTTLEQLRVSLELYLAAEPELLERELWFTGADVSGLYLVTEQRQYALLTQVMLAAAVTARGFRHNVCLFPLLARLYFTRYQADSGAEQRGAIDEHALECYIAVLAHWLGIEVEEPPSAAAAAAEPVGSPKRTYSAFAQAPSAPSACVFPRLNCHVPRRGEEEFERLRALHRFVAYLERLAGLAFAGPLCVTDAVIDAIGGFIEVKRPRCVPRALAAALHGCVPELALTAHDALDGTVRVVDPWCIYAAALHERLPSELATELFLRGGLAPAERRPLTLASLRRSDAIPEACCAGESAATAEYDELTRSIADTYNRAFVVPFAGSERVIADEFAAAESFTPLSHLVRQIEALVAPPTLNASLRSDAMRGFDFADLLVGRSPFAIPTNDADTLAMPPPVRHGANAEVRTRWLQRSMRSDGRSILPIGFSYLGLGHRHQVTFFERHFSVVSFVGGTYAEQLIERGAPLHVAQREVYKVSRRGQTVQVAQALQRPAARSQYRPKGRDEAGRSDDAAARDPGRHYAQHEASHDAAATVRREQLNRAVNLCLSHAHLFDVDSERLRRPAHRTLRGVLVQLRRMAAPPPEPPSAHGDEAVFAAASGMLYSLDASATLHVLHCPLVVPVHRMPFRFTSFAAMSDFVASRLRMPLTGEQAAEYVARLRANVADRNANYCNIVNSMAGLYAVCGVAMPSSGAVAALLQQHQQVRTPSQQSYVGDARERVWAEQLADVYATAVGELYRSGVFQAVVVRDALPPAAASASMPPPSSLPVRRPPGGRA